jgi:predicted ArsR family transcriptional regulator
MASKENQTRKRLKQREGDARPKKTVVTGMQTELRTHIIVLLNERAASRPEICKELGAPSNNVRYEMDVLKKLDPPLIELVYEKPVRGTVEKFYRATEQARIDGPEWSGVPDVIKGKMRSGLLDMIVSDAVAAIAADAYDSIEDAHMSWGPMILDETGWEETVLVLARALEEVEKIKEDSKQRLGSSGAKGTSCTVSILAYGSANEARTVGPLVDEDEDTLDGEAPAC